MSHTPITSSEREILRRAIEELDVVSRRVDAVARELATVPAVRPTGVRGAGKVLSALSDLEQDIWDADPTLVPEADYPSLHLDLDPDIEQLSGAHEMLRRNAIVAVAMHLPPELRARFRSASDAERPLLAKAWWSSQPRPSVAREHLHGLLGDARRWRRYVAARVLSMNGIADVWASEADDVNPAAVRAWYEDAIT